MEGQSTKIFLRQSVASALCPGEAREWQVENKTSKVHFTILAAALGKHKNRSDGVSDCSPCAAWLQKLWRYSEPGQKRLLIPQLASVAMQP